MTELLVQTVELNVQLRYDTFFSHTRLTDLSQRFKFYHQTDQIIQQNRLTGRVELLRLPWEVRRMIYDFALVPASNNIFIGERSIQRQRAIRRAYGDANFSWALLNVSKQVREDALTYLQEAQENKAKFQLNFNFSSPYAMFAFLESRPSMTDIKPFPIERVCIRYSLARDPVQVQAAMYALQKASQLKQLELGAHYNDFRKTGSYRRDGRRLAIELFTKLQPWLQYWAILHQNPTASLSVLKLPPTMFGMDSRKGRTAASICRQKSFDGHFADIMEREFRPLMFSQRNISTTPLN